MIEQKFEGQECHSSSGKNSRIIMIVLGLAIVAAGIYHFWPGGKLPDIIIKEVSLSGIVYAEDNPSVVIEQKIVHEGETVNGVKVVEILPDKVEFEKDGQRWSQEVKTPAVKAE